MKLIEYIGEKINNKEAEKREIENNKKGLTYIFILDKKYCIDGDVGGNESKYINHGCEPNCDTELINNKIWFITKRDILPGEELYFDYEFPHDDTERNKCLCGSPNCRGFIQMLPPK